VDVFSKAFSAHISFAISDMSSPLAVRKGQSKFIEACASTKGREYYSDVGSQRVMDIPRAGGVHVDSYWA
jgi:hypothetical protein